MAWSQIWLLLLLLVLCPLLNGVSEGATKVEASDTNGNVKVDGAETQVYKLPDTVLDSGDTFVFDGGNA